jgi:hypothetical protein
VNIRTFLPGDETAQAALYNVVANALPGFKPATAADVQRRTRARAFDPTARFYAETGGAVVGYCVLEPDQGRVSFPWCRKGHEGIAGPLLEAALASAKARGLTRAFVAYRADWEFVQHYFTARGFVRARDVVNFCADPVELPTLLSRSKLPMNRVRREDVPAVAELGRGVIRVPDDKLEAHLFANPYFPAEAFLLLRDSHGAPIACGFGYDCETFANAKKVDPLAPCFRLGAFGTEGLNVKRINGLFSFVAKPELALTSGLALLGEISMELTEGSVEALAAQCGTDAPHLMAFYTRYFKEQGRFPVLELEL